MDVPIITTPASPHSMWSEDEIAVLRHYCNKVTYGELSELLPGRGKSGIGHKARQLGLVDTSRSLRKKSRAKRNEKCARCAWGTSLLKGRTQVLCSRWPCVKEGEA